MFVDQFEILPPSPFPPAKCICTSDYQIIVYPYYAVKIHKLFIPMES